MGAAVIGFFLVVILAFGAWGMITYYEEKKFGRLDYDDEIVEKLRQENRRLAGLLKEYMRENDGMQPRADELIKRTRKELESHNKRELGLREPLGTDLTRGHAVDQDREGGR